MPARPLRMTLEEFLAIPEEPPYLEFADGEVLPRNSGGFAHGAMVAELGALVGNYLRQSGEGHAGISVTHATFTETGQRVFLPDITVFPAGLRRWISRTGLVRQHPVFAIEVLSPEDRPGRVADRVQFYLRNGTQLLWLVDPEDETITAFRPNAEAITAAAGDIIDAAPVLSAFTLDVAGLFAAVRD